MASGRMACLILFILAGLFRGTASAQVVVYEHAQFRGASATFSRNIDNFSYESGPCAGRNFNDCISSLRIPAGLSVTLYEDSNYRGASITFRGDVPTLAAVPGPCRGVFDECVSSMRISGSPNPQPTLTLRITKAGAGTGDVTSSPAGINCGATCSYTFPAGTQVSLTARSDANSRLNGFTGACQTSGSTCTFVLSNNATVFVTFDLQVVVQPLFRIEVTKSGGGLGTVSSSPPGLNCGTMCSATYAAGTLVTLTASPDANSMVAGFSGACRTGASTCAFVLTNNAIVSVSFEPRVVAPSSFTLRVNRSGNGTGTVTSSPAGISCGTSCSGTYHAGTQVTLTANPDPDSKVTGFSGACQTGDATCSFVLTRDSTVSVAFDKRSPDASVADFVALNVRNSIALSNAAYFRFVLYYNAIRTPSFAPSRITITVPGEYGLDVLKVPATQGTDVSLKVGGALVSSVLTSAGCIAVGVVNPVPSLVCGALASGALAFAFAIPRNTPREIELTLRSQRDYTSDEYVVAVTSLTPQTAWHLPVLVADQFGRRVVGSISLTAR